jgi:hypothetical protein
MRRPVRRSIGHRDVFRPDDTWRSAVRKALALSRKLHEFFISRRHSVCCRKLTRDMVMGSPVHMAQCIAITGEIAEETARLIAGELGIPLVEDGEPAEAAV